MMFVDLVILLWPAPLDQIREIFAKPKVVKLLPCVFLFYKNFTVLSHTFRFLIYF